MESVIQARFEARAKIIKALAHPTRLFIVDELSRQERCVNELTEKIGADVSTVSKHLTILKNVGIVKDERRGAQIYYSLKMPCVLSFFGCIETVMQCNVEESMSLLRRDEDK
jgi:DNA-binding transcriptional ArsR family regulator